MNCHDVRDELARTDGMLDPKQDVGVPEHLATCRSCRHFQTALQEEDRLLRSALSFSELDSAEILELERRTLAVLAAESDVSAGPIRLLLPAAAAVGGVALVSIVGIETEPLRARLQDALAQSVSPSGVSIVLVASLLSALLGRTVGLLYKGFEPLEGGSK
jgi:anti-sigma factor RsiW